VGYTGWARVGYTSGTLRLPTLPTWLWIALAALLIVVINTVTIALCGPWDPWETHYGEVARQIIVRDDPLDLWWRPGYGPDGNAENTFWSKPALPFWLMALSMAIFGVGSRPAADELVRSPWPELALRLPSLMAGLLCAAFLGYVVWRLLREETPTAGRGPSAAARAGIFTAVVLSTMPQWALVARQALTDMFFVAPVVVAMGAWALAWSQPDRVLRRRTIGELLRRPAGEGGGLGARVRRWSVPWDRAYLVFLLGTIAVAIVPLTVLHMHVISADTVARVAKFAKKPGVPSVDTLRQIHLHMFIYWAAAAGGAAAEPALGPTLAGVDGGAVCGRGGVVDREGDDRSGHRRAAGAVRHAGARAPRPAAALGAGDGGAAVRAGVVPLASRDDPVPRRALA
jgi:hypothetical protein